MSETTPGAAAGPRPSVLRMAAPLVVSFVMRSLFTLVDTIYAAYLGDASVAAIGLTFPFEFLMIAVWVGTSTGLTSTLARAMGAGEGDRIESLLAASRKMVLVLVPIFTLIGAAIWLFAFRMVEEPELARQFQIYGTVIMMGSAFTSFWSIIPDSIVKAHQDTKATMWAGIWSNMINVVLNTVFTFVFHWGIFGIALSTVIGRIGGLVYALRKAGAHEARRKATGKDVVPGVEARPVWAILSLGLPAGVGYGLMAGESGVINLILKRLPDATEAIASYSIYYRILMIAIMPAVATSVAMLPFTARRFGEGDVAGMRRALREAMGASLGYCLVVVAPVLWIFGPAIAAKLGESPETVRYTTTALWLCPFACVAALPFFLCRPMFEGMQMAKPGLFVALLRYVVLTAPLAWLGTRLAVANGYPGLYGILGGVVAATAISSAVLAVWLVTTLGGMTGRRVESGAVATA